jgi:glycosyltransferase involved in cell wall biosynthesis
MSKKLISVVTPCYNEEDNVVELHRRISEQMSSLPNFDYEHLFIDNASTDRTVELIKGMARSDSHVRLIVNNRNYGHIRSPMHAVLSASGDAVVTMASDLQDPPELIPRFIAHWESGIKAVIGVKPASRETWSMWMVRRLYYLTLGRISDVHMIPNFTGFGLYDREVIDHVRACEDPYPYFRGMISEFGYAYAAIPFEQPRRVRGLTKNNFFTLYDLAMLGMTSHSRIPLRVATMVGFVLAAISLVVALGYLVAKLLMWQTFSLGLAPILIGFFFFSSVQLIFIGILGEYIGAIHTRVQRRPLVVEKERFNFPVGSARPGT